MASLFPDKDQATDVRTFVLDDSTTDDDIKSDADIKADLLSEALLEDANSFVMIHRLISGGNMPEEYISRLPADKYDYGQLLEYLRENYGGGDYRVRLYVKGRLKKGGNKLIQIAKKITPSNVALSHAGEAASILDTVLGRMEENNQRMLQILQSRTEPTSSRKDMLEELAMMSTIINGGQKSGSMLGAVKEMAEVMTLMQGLSGGVEKESMLTSALNAFAPVAVAALQRPQGPVVRQYTQPRPVKTVNTPTQKPVTEPKKETNPMDEHAAAIKQIITVLETLGENGVAPSAIAEKITESIDTQEKFDALETWVTNPTCIDDLVKLDKNVERYKSWFLLLIEHVKAQMGLSSSVSDEYEDEDEEDGEIPLEREYDFDAPVDSAPQIDNTKPHDDIQPI
jgi:hypothetical protein